jgi:hypothetical protein
VAVNQRLGSPGALSFHRAVFPARLIARLQAVALLTLGVNKALRRCVKTYDSQFKVQCVIQKRDAPSLSLVNSAVLVDDIHRVLMEANSFSLMNHIRDMLPPHGMRLVWKTGGRLLSKVFLKVDSYLLAYSNLYD